MVLILKFKTILIEYACINLNTCLMTLIILEQMSYSMIFQKALQYDFINVYQFIATSTAVLRQQHALMFWYFIGIDRFHDTSKALQHYNRNVHLQEHIQVQFYFRSKVFKCLDHSTISRYYNNIQQCRIPCQKHYNAIQGPHTNTTIRQSMP